MIKNIRHLSAGWLLCFMAACTHITTPPTSSHSTENTPIPYPEPNERETLNDLATQVTRLEQQLAQLNARVQKLETNKTASNHVRRQPAPTTSTPPVLPATVRAHAASKNHDQRAQEYYQQGKYQAAADLLRDAESGGDGSLRAQENMYLLLQSQQKLNHCQSVIIIGQRYVARFAQSPRAADALYAVGQCQWQLQQRDIAKETWRNLTLRYPNTPAARRATLRLGGR